MTASAPETAAGSLATLKLALQRGKPPGGLLVVAGLLTLVEVAGTLAFPLLARGIVDRLGDVGLSAAVLMGDRGVRLLLLVLVGSAAAAATSRYLTALAGLQMVARLKTQVFDSLITAPIKWLEGKASGDQASHVMNDTRALSQLVSRETLNAFAGLLLLCGAAIVLFSLDAALAAILFGVITLAFLTMLPAILAMAAITAGVQATSARLNGRLTQVFSEIRTVKAFGAEAAERRQASADIRTLYRLGRRTARVESALSPVMTLAVMLSLVTILTYGGARVAAGTLSSGTLMAFLLYIFTVVGPLAQISSFFSALSSARGASQRLVEALEAPSEAVISARGADARSARLDIQPGDIEGVLQIDGLRFGYADPARPTLAIDRLVFPAGSRTALIGPSGSGKSTLLALVLRFHQPDRGCIRYGNQDIAAIDLATWRARIGYVSQAATMMSGSIRDNLLYGLSRPVADAELTRALQLAHCFDFVQRLPLGIDTEVGERGARLSGGEAQRVAIARMFLRDPEILLLDEATSHLDEESAHLVLRGLEALMQGRTSIYVTHRLTGIAAMNRIVMLDQGQVAEDGAPEALLEASDAYRRLIHRQFEETV